MNNARIHALISSLDQAVDILAEQRTPDAICVQAFDALKQARALVIQAFGVDPACAAYPEEHHHDAAA